MTRWFFTACFAAWQVATIVSLLALAGSARAQEKVLIINGTTMNDVVASFRLKNNSANAAISADNLAKLQAKANAGPPVYPWFFPGETSGTAGTYISDSLHLATATGRSFVGCGGMGAPGGTGGGPTYDSRLKLLYQNSTHTGGRGTVFNGSTRKLTSGGAGTAMTVTGRDVLATDAGKSVRVSGGTNVTPGWYGIASATPGASPSGVWTLDRAWCTGAVTNGTGEFCPPIIVDETFGTRHQGMTYTFRQFQNSDLSGSVLYHIPSKPSGQGNANGKQHFEDCAFAYAQVGILSGRSMAGAYPEKRLGGTLTNNGDGTGTITATSNNGLHGVLEGETITVNWATGSRTGMTVGTVSGTSIPIDGGTGDALPATGAVVVVPQTLVYPFEGKDDDHSDHLCTTHCSFGFVETPFYHRNKNSVNADHTDLSVSQFRDAIFRYDSGGKLRCRGLAIAGANSGTQCILRLGRAMVGGSGPYIIRDFNYDAQTRNPQLVVNNWAEFGSTVKTSVVFDGGLISRTTANDGYPLVDIAGAVNLSISNVEVHTESGVFNGLWPGCLRLKSAGGTLPHVVIVNTAIDVVSDVSELVDEANSDAGATVEFIGCYDGDDRSTLVAAPGQNYLRYTTTGTP